MNNKLVDEFIKLEFVNFKLTALKKEEPKPGVSKQSELKPLQFKAANIKCN